MKKLLCLLVILSGTIHAQEATEAPVVENTTKKKYQYKTHSIAISQRLGGVVGYLSDVGLDPESSQLYGYTERNTYGFYMTSIEFFTQRRKGRTQYTPMLSVRLGYTADNNFSLGGFHWGFLFGGSQYIFDQRDKQTGLGWSMLANGGLTIDVSTIDKISENPLIYPIVIGGEVDFKTIYNFNKNVGVTFGVNFGYGLSFDASVIGSGQGMGVVFDHNFVWALNAGFIF